MFKSYILGIGLLAVSSAAFAADDLSKLSFDDLMDAEVTSVARRGQKLSDTPAAVFVITDDDIRRSGATTIPDLLRMVPGLDVAAIDNNVWAVSARGFNGRWSNKLLVMIDGRTIDSPVFSGVFWDAQDIVLEDIDRIEVIRGPGGTLWGVNAVNGVINIITKNAVATHGTLLSVTQGTGEHGLTTAQYGGAIGDRFHYRAFVKGFDRPRSSAFDGSSGRRGGFRADWTATPKDNVSIEGTLFRGSREELMAFVTPADPYHGPRNVGFITGAASGSVQWTETQSTRSETKLQISYGAGLQHSPIWSVDERSFDADFQHQLTLGTRNEVVWGVGYRRNSAAIGSPADTLTFGSSVLRQHFFSGFVQDELRLPGNVRVTFGAKAQHERGHSPELQPTLRLLWHPAERHVLWGAATRAIRTPAWAETAGSTLISAFPDPQTGHPAFVVYQGNPDLRSERSRSFELGYRWLPNDTFSVDVTAFDEDFDRLIASQVSSPYRDAEGTLITPIAAQNSAFGHARGLELFATSQVNDRLQVSGGYTFLHEQTSNNGGGWPQSQAQLRSVLRLTPRLELDSAAYFVGRLQTQPVPAYLRVDGRLTWHADAAWDVSAGVQNLADARHLEFIDHQTASMTTRRSVYGTITWHVH